MKKMNEKRPMTKIEQRIRDLPLAGPSDALDLRMTELFESARLQGRIARPAWTVLFGTALAAGLAGFAAGISLGEWMHPSAPAQPLFASENSKGVSAAVGSAATIVLVSDSHIGRGLDFSHGLEPFRIHPVSSEGS
jgi:hypothetical protein